MEAVKTLKYTTLFALAALLVNVLASSITFAADRYLGRLVSYDGGQMVKDDYTTALSVASLTVPKGALLSVQCTEATYVNVFPDAGTAPTVYNTVKVPADALFTTSATADSRFVIAKPVSVVVDAGCVVYERQGNE